MYTISYGYGKGGKGKNPPANGQPPFNPHSIKPIYEPPQQIWEARKSGKAKRAKIAQQANEAVVSFINNPSAFELTREVRTKINWLRKHEKAKLIENISKVVHAMFESWRVAACNLNPGLKIEHDKGDYQLKSLILSPENAGETLKLTRFAMRSIERFGKAYEFALGEHYASKMLAIARKVFKQAEDEKAQQRLATLSKGAGQEGLQSV